MRNRTVLTIAAVAALLAGCGGGSSTSDDAATSAPATSGEVAGPAPQDARTKEAAASKDAALTLTDVRIGRHPGFERVVFELGGDGAPGWRVGYVDRALQDGSGNPVEVAGRSILEVNILGSVYPFDSKVPTYSGPNPATDSKAPGIAGVYQSSVFEGTAQSFIGVNADKPNFSVTALTGPTRLVVDIAT